MRSHNMPGGEQRHCHVLFATRNINYIINIIRLAPGRLAVFPSVVDDAGRHDHSSLPFGQYVWSHGVQKGTYAPIHVRRPDGAVAPASLMFLLQHGPLLYAAGGSEINMSNLHF